MPQANVSREPRYNGKNGLCPVVSDGAGSIESLGWATLTRKRSGIKKFRWTLLSKKRGFLKAASNLRSKPEVGLKETLKEVEKSACSCIGGMLNPRSR